MKSQLVTKVDLKKLQAECAALPYYEDGSTILMANAQSNGIPDYVASNCPTIQAAIDELTKWRAKKAVNLMVNKVPSGCVCPMHTDNVPDSPERYHLPIVTTPHALWWDEKEGFLQMLAGNWYGPMPYTTNHRVLNFGPEERIHLIVDVEK